MVLLETVPIMLPLILTPMFVTLFTHEAFVYWCFTVALSVCLYGMLKMVTVTFFLIHFDVCCSVYRWSCFRRCFVVACTVVLLRTFTLVLMMFMLFGVPTLTVVLIALSYGAVYGMVVSQLEFEVLFFTACIFMSQCILFKTFCWYEVKRKRAVKRKYRLLWVINKWMEFVCLMIHQFVFLLFDTA